MIRSIRSIQKFKTINYDYKASQSHLRNIYDISSYNSRGIKRLNILKPTNSQPEIKKMGLGQKIGKIFVTDIVVEIFQFFLQ